MLVGGVVAPWLFATLIGDGTDRGRVILGYAVASVLVVVGGLIEFLWGVNAERRSLEDVAGPEKVRREWAHRRPDVARPARPYPDGCCPDRVRRPACPLRKASIRDWRFARTDGSPHQMRWPNWSTAISSASGIPWAAWVELT